MSSSCDLWHQIHKNIFFLWKQTDNQSIWVISFKTLHGTTEHIFPKDKNEEKCSKNLTERSRKKETWYVIKSTKWSMWFLVYLAVLANGSEEEFSFSHQAAICSLLVCVSEPKEREREGWTEMEGSLLFMWQIKKSINHCRLWQVVARRAIYHWVFMKLSPVPPALRLPLKYLNVCLCGENRSTGLQWGERERENERERW